MLLIREQHYLDWLFSLPALALPPLGGRGISKI